MSNKSWSIFSIWNQSLLTKPEREIKPRSYLFASEVGKAPSEIFLKLKGVPPSNPFNDRAKRKMESGNLFQGLVALVLFRSGILLDEEIPYKLKYPNLLEISGRADILAGGTPDWEKVKAEMEKDITWERFPFIIRTIKATIENLSQKYPNGLSKQILEIKSCSGFMFELYEKNQTADVTHKIQTYTYLKADSEIKQANIFYISRDDARAIEIGIFENPVTDKQHYDVVKKITDYYQADEMPPLEPEIVWKDETLRFAPNWQVQYSPYLTKIYGWRDPEEFRLKYDKQIISWNYTLNRALENKDLTARNLEVIHEINQSGFNFEQLVVEAKEQKREVINNDS